MLWIVIRRMNFMKGFPTYIANEQHRWRVQRWRGDSSAKMDGIRYFMKCLQRLTRSRWKAHTRRPLRRFLETKTRNLTPPVADIVTGATEQSRLTCEFCAYTPAFVRTTKGPMKGHIACGRCLRKATPAPKGKASKRSTKPRRAPDMIVVKR